MDDHPLPRGRARLALATIAGLLLAVLGVGTPSASAAYNPADIEKSIVQLLIQWKGSISYTNPEGETEWFPASFVASCSGAFVSTEAHISTAGHCVDDSDKQEIGTQLALALLRENGIAEAELDGYLSSMTYDDSTFVRTVWAYQNDEVAGAVLPPRGLKTEVVAFQQIDQGDNALLQVNNFSRETPALPVAEAKLAVGDRVVAIGFPDVVTVLSDAARQHASFKSGEVSSFQTSNSGVAFVETSAVTSPGMSGGPVVNGNGEVVGSVSYGPSTREVFNFATLGLREFLLTNGVPLPVPETPSPTDPQPPVPMMG